MQEQNEHFPSGPQALLLVIALFIVEYLVSAALIDLQGVLPMSPSQSDAIVSVVANGCLFSFIMHVKSLSYRDLFHSSSSSAAATFAVLIVPVLMLVPALVLAISSAIEVMVQLWPLSSREAAMFERMGAGGLASVLVTCAIAPIVEEMLFRGVILRSFLTQYSKPAAIVGSALLFGLAHMNIYQFVAAFILGVVSGWLYERVRSLIPCIALHVSYNGALTVIDWLDRSNDAAVDAMNSMSAWAIALLCAAAGLMLLVSMLHRPRLRA